MDHFKQGPESWDDEEIANETGLTEKQVNKWRWDQNFKIGQSSDAKGAAQEKLSKQKSKKKSKKAQQEKAQQEKVVVANPNEVKGG